MPQRVYAIPGTQCDERLWGQLKPHLHDVEWVHVPVPEAGSVEQLVHDLLSLLPPTPVDLFGFSLGAYLAATLACTEPARVQSMFLCSNTPCALPEEELRQREQLLLWVSRNGYQGISDRKIRTMISPANHHRMDLFATIKAMDAALGEASLVQQLSATSARKDLLAPLSRLELPIRFCAGAEDGLVDDRWFAEWAALGKPPASRIDNAGHMLPLEAPELLAGEVLRWLNR